MPQISTLIDKSEAFLAVFILALSTIPAALLLLLFLSLRLMDCVEDCHFHGPTVS